MHHKAGHNFGQTSNFSAIFFVFAEQKLPSLQVVHSPGLSATVGRGLVHENLGQLNLFGRDVRLAYDEGVLLVTLVVTLAPCILASG